MASVKFNPASPNMVRRAEYSPKALHQKAMAAYAHVAAQDRQPAVLKAKPVEPALRPAVFVMPATISFEPISAGSLVSSVSSGTMAAGAGINLSTDATKMAAEAAMIAIAHANQLYLAQIPSPEKVASALMAGGLDMMV